MSESLTQKAAAERLGISTWKLRQLSNAGDVPRNEDKSYPWPEVREAFDRIEGESRNSPATDEDELEAEEALTQKEAASRLGISTWKLRQLSNAGDVPRSDEDGSYPWPAVLDAFERIREDDEPEETELAPEEEEGEDGLERLTQEELAERLCLSTRRIRDMHDEGLPRLDDGRYDWGDTFDWYIELKQMEALRQKGYDENGSGTLTEEKRRKTAAEARLKELKLAERRGELVPRSDVLELVEAPLRSVDQALRQARTSRAKAWAERLDLTEAEAMDLLDDLVEEVRSELRSVFETEAPNAAA